MKTVVIFEQNKKIEEKREQTRKMIFIYDKALIIKEAIEEIINCTKYGGKYDQNKINEAVDKIENEACNILYYNNI